MYHYVEDKLFEKQAKKFSSELVKQVELDLRKNRNINSQLFLVGSSGRNMITQNEDGPIDFDYNLNILKCPDWNNTKQIKETVRKSFNKVLQIYGLGDVGDSTSCLSTNLIYFKNSPNKKFSIDLAIVTLDNEEIWNRLIHQKTGNTNYDKYIWNRIPNSTNIKHKSEFLKINNYWEYVRQVYLNKKNFYLKTQDEDSHPSFVCYIETINEIYQQLKNKNY